ncbi:MAG: tRNA (N(6)-L-threonylcarbamoyladenosine(37)-C(2))-methylthiotransferase MtaB [bacterium]
MPKANLHTLGCRLNQAETAIIAKSLTEVGFEIVDTDATADLTVVNTCTVTEQADAKCRQAVRRALRRNPRAFVAVVGCYSQMAVEVISAIEGVDLIIGNEHKLKVGDYLNGLQKQSPPQVVHTDVLPLEEFVIDTVGLYDSSTRANLKLQDGCNFFCSFCIIPTARGRARSRNFEDLLREAHLLAEAGHQEIVLTGVNIGTYKSEGKRLLAVIQEMEKIEKLRRIRISSIEPTTINPDLVRYMANSEKLCRHLHIPLQSGDDRILKTMKRRHTAAQYGKFVEWVAQTVPDIGLGSDIMVGFPGEGDEVFSNGKRFIADLPLAYFHVFTYSDRLGAKADKLTDKVDPQTKKLRTRIMIELGLRKQTAFYERHLGRTIDILFESQENGHWLGLADNYMRVQVKSDDDLHNRFRKVKLLEVAGDRITAKLL